MREQPEERQRGGKVRESQGSLRSWRYGAGRSPNGPRAPAVASILSSTAKETDPRG